MSAPATRAAAAPRPTTTGGGGRGGARWVVWSEGRRAPEGPWRAGVTCGMARDLALEHARELRLIGSRWHRRVTVARGGDPPPAWFVPAADAERDGGRA